MAVKRNYDEEPMQRQQDARRKTRGFGNDIADAYSNNFRKVYGAKSTDYFCSLINAHQHHFGPLPVLSACPPPYKEYGRFLFPATHARDNPMSSLCTQWINTVYNYDSSRNARIDPVTGQQVTARGAFMAILWTAGGRRLIASTSLGDFVLWNGHSYTMESRVNYAHENGVACRVLKSSSYHDLLVSADDAGIVKLWKQSDLSALGKVEAHAASQAAQNSDGTVFRPTAHTFRNASAIKDLSLAPFEEKFVTASRDGSARIWDADSLVLENKLLGHGGDVLSAHWHPHFALIATSSADTDIRLWDPRVHPKINAGHLATMQDHVLAVTRVRFCPNHQFTLLSASKDMTMRLWDIRMLKTTSIFSGHTKETSDIAWHPHHKDLFASVGFDGVLAYWVVNYGAATKFYKTELTNDGSTKSVHDRWVAAIPDAHGSFRSTPAIIQSVSWHPLGHVLATSAFDGRLWSRTQPGTEVELRYSENQDQNFDTTRTAEGAKVELYKRAMRANAAPEHVSKLSSFVETNTENLVVGSSGCIYVRPGAPKRIYDKLQMFLAAQQPVEATDSKGTVVAEPADATVEECREKPEPSVQFLL